MPRAFHRLYLESPAGSGESSGYSTCIKGGKPVSCSWDDVNQGEAYAHTLAAFYKAFPELASNPLVLALKAAAAEHEPEPRLEGEGASQAGRCVPAE